MAVTTSGDPADETAKALARAVGTIVAQLRRDRGWSLEDLADEAGRHRTCLGLVERGERHLSIAAAYGIAQALDLSLSTLLELAETASLVDKQPVRSEPRKVPPGAVRRGDAITEITRLNLNWIQHAVEDVYRTLGLIDEQLVNTGSLPLPQVVELANLSAIIGNLLRAALATHSHGRYKSNEPHKFPDLISDSQNLGGLEIKVALEKNMPKGHLPKPGPHLICRYVLANRDGTYAKGIRGDTAWIWEMRLGSLTAADFALSNTEGDSGKTVVVKSTVLDKLHCIYYDHRFLPYATPRPGHCS